MAVVARAAASDCSDASTTHIRCATLATMWCGSARGGMRTTVGTVGKWDVEQLGVVGGLLHAGADGVLGCWALGQPTGVRFYCVGGLAVIGM